MNGDSEYIALCKKLIEEKFSFESGEGALRQRDLEYLARSIEEKSGIRLSLSTLKRLWKKDYDQTPHPSTLDALVSLLGFRDWQEFKLKQTIPSSSEELPRKKSSRPFNRWMAVPLVVAFVIFFWLIAFRAREPGTGNPVIKGPVTFKGNKTVSRGVPNTIIFNYDVSNIEADSFFFQQSWNEKERVRIDPKGHYYSTIYYYPGFHRAKLIANDSIVSRFRAHITTDGWMPIAQNVSADNSTPLYIKNANPMANGVLHVTRNDLFASGLNLDREFVLSYYNVREFEDTFSDNFSLETRIAFDSSSANPCPAVQLVIICEEHIFYVSLIGKGCERHVLLKMGEVKQDGVNTDLSAFGRDRDQWQDLQIQVVNKQATIYLDNKPVHTISFKKDFGKVVGLVYNFNGTGSVDYARLRNGQKKLVLEDEFGG
jgi:hypothetical protein